MMLPHVHVCFIYVSYRSAADAVGEVTSCSDGQLSSFITLAKSAYGSDITTWDSTTITNIGIVIG